MLGYGDFDTVMDVMAKAVAKGPYLMGEQFTAADVVIGSGLRWGMMFKLLPERPEFTRLYRAPGVAAGAAACRSAGQGARRGVMSRRRGETQRIQATDSSGFH